MGRIRAIAENIEKALERVLPQIIISERGSFPFLHQSLYHFLNSCIPGHPNIGIFITNSYADNGTSRIAIEAYLQRYLSNETFILIATLSDVEEAIHKWMKHISERHPSYNQIDILWHEETEKADTTDNALKRKLLPWAQRKLGPS